MSMNDGGWDDAGFDDGSHGGGSGTGGGWDGPPAGGSVNPGPAHAAPVWTTPKVILPAAGIAVAAIVVLVVLLATGGHSAPTAATPPPSTSSTPKPTPKTSPTKPPTKPPTTPKSTAPKLVSLAEYDDNVDRICGDDGPKLQRALDRGNSKSLDSLVETEIRRLQMVDSPDDDSDQARQWLDDLLKSVQASSPAKYVADAKATAALAKQLGMHECQKALPFPGK